MAESETPKVEPLDGRIVEALADVATWGQPVEHVQTHLSHVFLTRDRVYKLRKAVHFGFVDFSTRSARARDCRAELALNRRLSPDVYLGVASVEVREDGVHVGPLEPEPGSQHEWVVVMRRLPSGGDALARLEQGGVTAGELGRVAEQIADLHADHRLDLDASGERILDPVRHNFDELRACGDAVAALIPVDLEEKVHEFERDHLDAFAGRRAVDGHGDLHLAHLWLDEDGDTRIIDALEFSAELRQLDPVAEVAFLTMDLRYRGRDDLAEHFAARYAERADDWALYGLLSYYESYRATVRAKVAALAASDADVPEAQRAGAQESCSRHLALARRVMEPRATGALVLTCGTVGSGKSTVARALAERLPALVLASDRLRKRLAGLDESAHTKAAWGEGVYGKGDRSAVYTALLARAEAVLVSGRHAIVDASFAAASWRDEARALAERIGARAWLVEVVCPPEVARERLRVRAARGADPSDAGPELLEQSLAHYETPDEWPAAARFRIESDRPIEDAVARAADRIAAVHEDCEAT